MRKYESTDKIVPQNITLELEQKLELAKYKLNFTWSDWIWYFKQKMAKYFSNTFSKVFQLPTQRNKSFLNLPNLFIVFIKIILPIQNIWNVITNERSTTLQQHRRNFIRAYWKKFMDAIRKMLFMWNLLHLCMHLLEN